MKTDRYTPAEVFPVGSYLSEELAARGWTQSRLAQIMDRPLQTVNQIINGKKRITEETALVLGESLETGPEVWLNLETAYRLFLAKKKLKDILPKVKERRRKLQKCKRITTTY